MKNTYPVILTPEKDGFIVFIPDFNANTQGKDLTDAIEMARDAIGLLGIDLQDEKRPLPNASSFLDVKKQIGSEDIVTLVDVDFEEYRKKNDMRSVKKNCTIPSWLNYEAEKAGLNFSAILQAALKAELQVKQQ